VKKKEHIMISIGAIIGGWLLCGFAATSTLGPPMPTIGIVSGLGFAVGGFISLILSMKKPPEREK
jgi:hypothetical protein